MLKTCCKSPDRVFYPIVELNRLNYVKFISNSRKRKILFGHKKTSGRSEVSLLCTGPDATVGVNGEPPRRCGRGRFSSPRHYGLSGHKKTPDLSEVFSNCTGPDATVGVNGETSRIAALSGQVPRPRSG